MKTKYISKNILVLVVLLLVICAQPSRADIDTSIWYRGFYNVGIIGTGVQWYWEVNGIMPDSVSDLYDAGMIPMNLVNAVTGQQLALDPAIPGPGDVNINGFSNQAIVISHIQPDGQYIECPLDSSLYAPDPSWPPSVEGATRREYTNEADMKIHYYLSWAQISLEKYYNEKGSVPGSIEDLINAGYWPFDGIMNPVTNMPMQFYSSNPGDFNFEFGYKVLAAVHFTDGKEAVATVSPETGYTSHF